MSKSKRECWAICVSARDGEQVLRRVAPAGSERRTYVVAEDAAVRDAPRGAVVGTLRRGCVFASARRVLDARGEMWVSTSIGVSARGEQPDEPPREFFLAESARRRRRRYGVDIWWQ